MKVMTVQDIACAFRMKRNIAAAYLSPCSKRHEQQNHDS